MEVNTNNQNGTLAVEQQQEEHFLNNEVNPEPQGSYFLDVVNEVQVTQNPIWEEQPWGVAPGMDVNELEAYTIHQSLGVGELDEYLINQSAPGAPDPGAGQNAVEAAVDGAVAGAGMVANGAEMGAQAGEVVNPIVGAADPVQLAEAMAAPMAEQLCMLTNLFIS